MNKRKILIVDDEAIVAGELEGKLASLGYEVAGIASSAGEAIAMTAEASPDLVLMDMVLAGDASGIDAAAELRQRWSIPIVFMPASGDEASLERAGVTAPHGYVLKPVSGRELSLVIDLALCKHEAATAVHELEDRFFAVSIDLLCFLDFNGYFKRLNPAWERTLGFTSAELMSKPFIEFVHPDDRERTLKQNRAVRGRWSGPHLREPLPLQGWLLSMVSVECGARSRGQGHLLRGARHHRGEAGTRRAREAGERASGGSRRSQDAAGDPADLLVLPEDS